MMQYKNLSHIYIITHADRSCGTSRVFFTSVCLSVCVFPHDMCVWLFIRTVPQKVIIKLDIHMFYGESWKLIYLGVKRSKVTKTVPEWVIALL